MKKYLFALLTSLTLIGSAQMINCNYTAKSWGEVLYANPTAGATSYQFQFINSATSFTQTWINPGPCACTALYDVPGLTTGLTYTIAVASSTDNGSTWSVYSPTCTLTSPADYTTTLIPADCGATATTWSQLFSCYPGGDPSTNYKFTLTNTAQSYTQAVMKLNENIAFSLYTGLQASTTYTCDVEVFYLGAWRNAGPTCNLTTPTVPTTSLQPAFCGYTAPNYSSLMTAVSSSGTKFRFLLENQSLSYSQTFTNVAHPNVNFAQYTSLSNGTTYSMSVGVFYNGSWGPYGNVCQVTTPSSLPTTSIVPANCGYTPAHYSTLMYVGTVAGHTGYGYQLTNAALSYVGTYTSVNQNFNFYSFGTGVSALPLSTTYTIQARVQVNGVWGPYGPACTISTPGVLRPAAPYPNPSSTHFTTEYPVIVMDVYGKEVERIEIGDFGHEYPKGLYYIKMGEENYKLIKQ